MSHRSEIKKVVEKYYPQYKIETVYSPNLHIFGFTGNEEIKITAKLKKLKTKKHDNRNRN